MEGKKALEIFIKIFIFLWVVGGIGEAIVTGNTQGFLMVNAIIISIGIAGFLVFRLGALIGMWMTNLFRR